MLIAIYFILKGIFFSNTAGGSIFLYLFKNSFLYCRAWHLEESRYFSNRIQKRKDKNKKM